MDPFPPGPTVIKIFVDRIQAEGVGNGTSSVNPDANLVARIGPCDMARWQRRRLEKAAQKLLPRFQGIVATAAHQLPPVSCIPGEDTWAEHQGARRVVCALLAKVALAYGGLVPEVRHMQVPY